MKKDLRYYTEKFEYHSLYLQQAINSIGLSYHGKNVDLVQEVYLSLLNRIGINIASIYHLSEFFLEENVSSSIALLFRACISDIILGYYLIEFKNDLQSFEGEIRIKDVEFLKYMLEVGPKEQKILSHKTGITSINFVEHIVDNFEDCIKTKTVKENGKIDFKSNSDIRKECRGNSILKKDDQNFQLTEKNIFDKLKNRNIEMEDHFDNIYIHWKYYSQFQHFSHLGKGLLDDKKENFLYYLMGSLIEVYNFLSVMQIIVFNFPVDDFDQAKNDLIQVYREFKPDQLE